MEKIEELLDLGPKEIEVRMKILEGTIRTKPETGFLKIMAKRFDVQPWPFVNYLAHYCPEEFKELLESYQVYDGAENSQSILEGLREQHVIYSLLEKKMKEKETVDI